MTGSRVLPHLEFAALLRMTLVTLVSVVTLGACDAGMAQSDPSQLWEMEAADGYLLKGLALNTAKEQYLFNRAQPLRQADRDSDGLDVQDLARIRTEADALRRANEIRNLLRWDYNGDLSVIRTELIENSKFKTAELREQEADRTMERLDTNNDGTATIEEAIVRAEDQPRHHSEQIAELLELDPNDDNRLTARELLAQAERVFDSFDKDGSGELDQFEFEVVRKMHHEIVERKRMVERGCIYPKASDNAQLIAYGINESETLSTAWVGSHDTETGIIDVTIEPGSRPLYLMLGSYDAMIWRFGGATDRIEQVIASSYETGERARDPGDETPVRSAVAAIGIDVERFEALGRSCLPRGWRIGDGDRERADRIAQMVAGRPIDVIAGVYSAGSVALPSGPNTQKEVERRDLAAPHGFDPEMWAEATRFSPGGIEHIDPSTLVTSQPVGAYKILPEQFGLAQLLASGALVRNENGWLVMTQNIAHWPSGLAGAHSVGFIVKDGVTPPKGRPGHSCVLSEAEAARVKGSWRSACPNRLRARNR